MAWIDDRRIGVKLLAIGVVAMLGMGLLAGAAILSQREHMLMDRTDKIKSLMEVTAGYAKSLQGLVQSGGLSQGEAEARLRAMVYAARFDGNNYIAVYRDDGTAFASPAQPAQEGTSRLDAKDANGLLIVQVARELVRAQGAGSFSYYFPRAGETTPLRKASFTKLLGMGDLFGITGVYVDDVDAALLRRTGNFALIVIPVLALSLGVTLLFNRSISGGLSLLSGAMVRLAKGDLAAEVPGAARGDELGVMARTVLVFRDAGLDKHRLEQQAEADRIEAEAERGRQDQERQMLAEEQAAVVRCLGEGLSQLSGGDLTCELQEAFSPKYEQLRADFNAAVSQLREVMTAIIGNTGTIHAGTIEISQAADNLSRRTEQQAASLEQTAAALDEITATVRRAAEGAEQAQRIAAETTADAERSGVVVQSTVHAMGEIETSARQISQIIGVIDEIAFQTNLLALNAGVEAARAGDAGRGFAVVASEVRALAQRSADAAKEIKTLIGASSRQVDQGVKLVGETGVALGRITGQVAQLDRAVTEIAAGAQEQAAGLSEVNVAVNQMDQVTQENAAMVEQSTAASQALSQDAAMLAELTGRFRLGEPSSGAGSPVRQAGRGSRAKSGAVERPSKPRLIAGGRMGGFG